MHFRISRVVHLRSFDMVLRNDFTFQFSKEAIMEKKALKVIHDFSNSVIVARRKELMEKGDRKQDTCEANEFGVKKRPALLDILLMSSANGEPLTNADIREEVDTFMFAGHDTTSSAISFALYCIAKHPEVQQKLIKEIRQVMGEDKNKPLTLQLLNELHYMDLVFKEVNRMYPAVPQIGRLMEEDVEISEWILI